MIYKTILKEGESFVDNKVNNESMNIEVRYLNETFKEMFTNQREKLKQLQKKKLKYNADSNPKCFPSPQSAASSAAVSPIASHDRTALVI